MSTRYLVAWAGDRHCADALRLGAVLASTFQAGLDVVYVAHVEHGVVTHQGERQFEDLLLQQARQRMTQAVAGLPPELDVQLHVLRSPSIPAGILQAAEQLGSSMVVLGGGHGIGLPLSSSVVSSLLHSSGVPVALAPRGYGDARDGRLSEVVCAVGTRPGAQDVVDETVEAVLRAGVPLHLVSLLDLGRDAGAPADAKQAAETALQAAHDKVAGRVPVTTEVAEGRDLKQAIGSIAWKPDSVVVVGSSRLATGRQTFLGTMANRMLASLPVPMIVVPAPKGEAL